MAHLSYFTNFFRCLLKKLRDVLQEREGTSLNCFKVFLNYIEQFPRSISVYLSLFWTISDYLSLSWTISVYLGPSQAILHYLGLSRTISDHLGLSGTIWDYLGLSGTIWDCLVLSGTIWGCGGKYYECKMPVIKYFHF